MLCISCFCSIFRQTSRFCTLHSRPKQCKLVLDFSWNPSWNLLEICSVNFVDTLQCHRHYVVVEVILELCHMNSIETIFTLVAYFTTLMTVWKLWFSQFICVFRSCRHRRRTKVSRSHNSRAFCPWLSQNLTWRLSSHQMLKHCQVTQNLSAFSVKS